VIDLDTALRLTGMRLGDRALIGPQVVQLDLTDACNNNCLGCWARSPMLHDEDRYDTLEKGSLDLAFVHNLLPVLKELRVREIFLGGGGEPLCHPEVLTVVREAKRQDFLVTLNTNLTTVDEKLLHELVEIGPDLLIVSLWAATGRTYSRLHPNKTERTFALLTENVKRLSALKQAAGSATPRVKLYQVICSLNLEEIPAMVDHAREAGAEELEFAVFDPIPRRTDAFTLDREGIARALELIEQLPKNDRPFIHHELFTRRLRNIAAAKGVFDNGIVASIPCVAGWFYSRVTTVGQVHACLKAHRVAAGDLREHDYRAVWFGHGMRTFRQHTLHLNPRDPWLRNIGHDLDFALPGCFRICDNLGHNQLIMKLVGGLTETEKKTLDEMTTAARRGAELLEIENVYRQRLAEVEIPKPSFSPAPQAEMLLHGDHSLIQELASDAAPWDDALARLASLPPEAVVRVPVSIHNVARLDLLLKLIGEKTGRQVDPDTLRLAPRPLADLHRRWPAQLEKAREPLAEKNVLLDLRDETWRRALWKIAAAARPDNEAELLRVLGALTGRAFIGPRTFHLDVTNRCAADCIYCWFHSPLAAARTDPYRLTDADRDALMDWDTFLTLADDLAALEAKEDVVLSGKGDPLSHPRLTDMIHELKARGLAVTLFTGGSGLTDRVLQALVEAELDMLYVSLSAVSEESFSRLQTRLEPVVYGRIVAAVRRLLDLRRAAGKEKPRVVLVDVITARNAGEVTAFAELAAKLGVDHLRYQLAAIETYNRELALSDAQRRTLAADLVAARRLAEAAGVAVIENIDFQSGTLAEGPDWTGERYRKLGCLAGYVFGRAWADGTLSFCCAPRPIGNLRDRSFADWWRSDAYDRLRLAARRLDRHSDYPLADGSPLWSDICRRCPNYEGIERLRDVLTSLDLLELLP